MNSLDIVPEGDFFAPTEFYSALKQKEVSDSDCESRKHLFETLKMRNLSDMNDLYNVQDVILLAEIIENRFEDMFKKYQSQEMQFCQHLKRLHTERLVQSNFNHTNL